MAQEKESPQIAALREQLNTIAQKIGELEGERDEHLLVIETLSSVEPERICYRLVDRVLVEGTQKQVLPIIKSNLLGIREIMKSLGGSYANIEQEIQKLATPLVNNMNCV